VHNSTQTSPRFPALFLALALLALQTSCESIIGLEDRTLVTNDGGGDLPVPGSPLCKSYCSDVKENCKPPNLDAYKSDEDCLAMCSFLPPGKSEATETKGNSVSCRAKYAKEAASVERDAMFCPAAAPGGGSPAIMTSCGSNCEAYCGLHKAICPDKEQKDCLNKCRAIPDEGKYSAANDYLGGDTIQCRIAHLTAAAQAKHDGSDADRADHCGHALLRASLGDRPFCDLPPQTEPNCRDYCKLVQQACTVHPVYDNAPQCEKACESFVKGKNTDAMNVQDSSQDTLACRRWHAYFAFDDAAETHCPHSGPTGDGHCGKICPAYCAMLKKGCPTQFPTEFPGGMAACETACAGLPGFKEIELGYDLASEETRTNTLQCRVRYLVESFSGGDTCAKAFPKGTCSR
jgi:hypothetical protein